MPPAGRLEDVDVSEGPLRSSRQVFVPSNFGTNTFVFDTVSFLSILTLVVFLVRVFSRVLRSNSVQRITPASDPSLSRSLLIDSVSVSEDSEMDTWRQWRRRRRRSMEETDTEEDTLSGRVRWRRRNKLPKGKLGHKQNDLWMKEWRTDSPSEITIPRMETDTILNSLHHQALTSETHPAPLDRRRHIRRRREGGRQLEDGQRQTAGIGGVSYQDIYLAIGVAATALFIIETLYKTYQLYTSSGRSLEENWIELVESVVWQQEEEM